ncbi:hypothetical protein ABZP36_019506 [Zizania latifolia]
MGAKLFVVFNLLFFFIFPVLGAAVEALQTYIVQLHRHEVTAGSEAMFASKLHWHLSFLEKSVPWEREKQPSSRLLYSYHTVFDGFAAQLTGEEAAALLELPGVASVRADRRVELHTTYSYKFLGLNFCPSGAWARSGFGGGTIIGELELVYAADGTREEEYCIKGSLSAAAVAGKMVVCDRGITGRADKGEAVKEAGGAAMILSNSEINQQEDSVDVHVLPATLIGYREAVELKKYISSTQRPVARIVFGGTRIGRARAPAVALFSARGPSMTNPSVLKPDVIAPGVNIIAAWPGSLGPSGLEDDARRSNFTVLSGTSMACPHVSGIAALIKSAHPSWNPAMIRSAIMTTADVTDRQGKPIMDGDGAKADLFAMGAGHVNPARAVDPGLVYDIDPADYVTHLCTLGYTHTQIFKIAHSGVNCSAVLQRNGGFSLNYPSISVAFKKGVTSAALQRTVTNVGTPNSTYTAQVAAPPSVKVRVSPTTLTFSEFGEKKSFRVSVDAATPAARDNAEGYLVWKQSGGQGKRRVRSPIAVTWVVE